MTSAALVGLVLGSLTLVGCSNSSETSGAVESDTSGEPSISAEAAASETFCADYDQAGLYATSIQLWLPQEETVATTGAILQAMSTITPPAEIADAWAQYTDILTRVNTESAALPPGERLSLAEGSAAELVDTTADDTIDDYYVATCE